MLTLDTVGRATPGADANRATVLLRLYLIISDPESQPFLSELLAIHAKPLVRRTVARRLDALTAAGPESQEVDDLCGEVMRHLVSRIHDLKKAQGVDQDGRDNPIDDFPRYVAVTACHICHEYVRRKRPERWRLKNRLRYLLSHSPAFAVWEGADGGLRCGLAPWRGGPDTDDGTLSVLRLRGKPPGLLREVFPHGDAARMNLLALLLALFRWIGRSVDLDALVGIVDELQDVKELSSSSPTVEVIEVPDACHVPDVRASVSTVLEQRGYLRRVWREICDLPLRQRIALLLNLTDSERRDIIALFPLTGIARIRIIATALAMQVEELAWIWNDLPLDDNRIARLMGIQRQQVINLRQAARTRLARHLLAHQSTALRSVAKDVVGMRADNSCLLR